MFRLLLQKQLILLFGCSALLLSCSMLSPSAPPESARIHPELRIAVFSDPHYFHPSLIVEGAAFDSFLVKDGKLIGESDAILRAAVEMIINEAPDVLLVPGDLTNTGELVSHQQFASYLEILENEGIKVYVVPGNHDIRNPDAQRFTPGGSVPEPNITAQEFETIYSSYGFSEAVSRDGNSLSYMAQIAPGIRLLALDPCRYGENTASKVDGGRFSESTKLWIKSQLQKARSEGCAVLGLMHHAAGEHFTGQAQILSGYILEDWKKLVSDWTRDGLKVIFTGHLHAQDVVSLQTAHGVLNDIGTGSLVTYPNSFRICTFSEDNVLRVSSRSIQSIDQDIGGVDFPKYAFTDLAYGIHANLIPEIADRFAISPEVTRQYGPLVVEALLAHYAGDESMLPSSRYLISSMVVDEDPLTSNIGYLTGALWDDPPPGDNECVIDLSQGRWSE